MREAPPIPHGKSLPLLAIGVGKMTPFPMLQCGMKLAFANPPGLTEE
jgi:hypothetical protein